jgi:glycosyltransferase involved in cell wall biosynthesis
MFDERESAGHLASGSKRILIFCDHYLPSKQGGGGVWTIVNLVERLSDRFQFFIVTRNHDNRMDRTPFTDVKTGEWNHLGNKEVDPDCVYLNSVFSLPTRKFLAARRVGEVSHVPVVLAPCGELSPGALQLKRAKKKVFLSVARRIGIYTGVTWKASTAIESQEITDNFGKDVCVFVAADLPPKRQTFSDLAKHPKPWKESGSVKLIFYSRIDRKKNLKFVIDRLKGVSDAEVDFMIVGPPEDRSYWVECVEMLERLPKNIRIKIVGPVCRKEGLKLLKCSHFLVLPTLGENFGYVFLEALAAGTPLIISDRTIWNNIQRVGAGWALPLEDPDKWSSVLKSCALMEQNQYLSMSAKARSMASDFLSDPETQAATERVFEFVLGN